MERASFEIVDPTHGPLTATWLAPSDAPPRGVCLFLYGGGGHPEMLWDLAPALQEDLEAGGLPAVAVACLGVPPWCFYLDDPAQGSAWESAVAQHLAAAAQARCGAALPLGLVGISMGGYGALKIALARPHDVQAVAAVAPMVEPWRESGEVPLRNRLHYPPQCPARLVGPQRDRALWRRDHPVARARASAAALRARDVAIRIDAGTRDAVAAHDGAESLHRQLWDLDVPHEYLLHRDADHVGPTVLPRLRAAFAWVGRALVGEGRGGPCAEESALREALSEARSEAAPHDPTLARTYGVL